MKAKIADIKFEYGEIVVSIDLFFTQGEVGYNDGLTPFKSRSINLPADTTKPQIIDAITAILKDAKQGYTKSQLAQSWIGQEITVI